MENLYFPLFIQRVPNNEIHLLLSSFNNKLVVGKSSLSRKAKNLSLVQQLFITNKILPYTFFILKDNKLIPITDPYFLQIFRNKVLNNFITYDIEVLNPNRLPDPNLGDKILSISLVSNEPILLSSSRENFEIKSYKIAITQKGIYYLENEVLKLVPISLDEKRMVDLSFEALSQFFVNVGFNNLFFDNYYIKERTNVEIIRTIDIVHPYPSSKPQFSKMKKEERERFNQIRSRRRGRKFLPTINIDLFPISQNIDFSSRKLKSIADSLYMEYYPLEIKDLAKISKEDMEKIAKYNISDSEITLKIYHEFFPIFDYILENGIGNFEYIVNRKRVEENFLLRYIAEKSKWNLGKIDKILGKINRLKINPKKIEFSPTSTSPGKYLNGYLAYLPTLIFELYKNEFEKSYPKEIFEISNKILDDLKRIRYSSRGDYLLNSFLQNILNRYVKLMFSSNEKLFKKIERRIKSLIKKYFRYLHYSSPKLLVFNEIPKELKNLSSTFIPLEKYYIFKNGKKSPLVLGKVKGYELILGSQISPHLRRNYGRYPYQFMKISYRFP